MPIISLVTMAASSGHLVDDFEGAFQNCIAAISNQDHISVNDPDEVKTSVEQSIQKFLDVAKQLESFFLQKRFVLSISKPEQILKEDIQELRSELLRKDVMLQKHQEKLQQWQALLARAHGATTSAGNATGQPPPTAQQQNSVQQTVPPPHGTPTGQPMPPSAQPQPPQPPPSQAMPPPSANTYPGPGPLAYLEQTTSNIGMPERR